MYVQYSTVQGLLFCVVGVVFSFYPHFFRFVLFSCFWAIIIRVKHHPTSHLLYWSPTKKNWNYWSFLFSNKTKLPCNISSKEKKCTRDRTRLLSLSLTLFICLTFKLPTVLAALPSQSHCSNNLKSKCFSLVTCTESALSVEVSIVEISRKRERLFANCIAVKYRDRAS